MAEKTMARSDWWRSDYRKRRYMRNLADKDIKERWEILVDNYLQLVPAEGKLGIAPIPFEREPHWIELVTHVLEELALRGAPPMGRLAHPDHRGFTDKVNYEDRREIFTRPEFEDGTFKLGELDHLTKLQQEGTIRLCPATYYGKGNYGYSIDDNEMQKFIQLNDSNSDIAGLMDGFSLHEFVRYEVKIPIVAPTDYYLFCMSKTFRYRHIFDFGYNACLRILNRTEFISRLRRAIKDRFGNSVEVHEINVTYVDPLNPKNKTKYFAMTMKHIKFSYQTEFRICIVPKKKLTTWAIPSF